MKFLKGVYAVMAAIMFVILTSEYILDGEYSGMATWACLLLFLLGTLFFVNAKQIVREVD